MSTNAIEQAELFTSDELTACDTRPKKPPKVMRLKYYDEPKNDNDLLFNLQYELIKNNNESALWEMWLIGRKVARRIIKKRVAARKLVLAPDEIEELVEETCLYLFRRYKTRKNYYIEHNFITAIQDSIRHALDYQNTTDKLTDYVEYNSISGVEWQGDGDIFSTGGVIYGLEEIRKEN